MTAIVRQHSNARMSKIVQHAGLIYLCGQTSGGTDFKGVHEQTVEVLGRIDALLTQAGSSRSHLLSVSIHLRDMADFAAMNTAWEAWVPAGCAPARTTVQAALASTDLLVEMTVIAAKAA